MPSRRWPVTGVVGSVRGVSISLAPKCQNLKWPPVHSWGSPYRPICAHTHSTCTYCAQVHTHSTHTHAQTGTQYLHRHRYRHTLQVHTHSTHTRAQTGMQYLHRHRHTLHVHTHTVHTVHRHTQVTHTTYRHRHTHRFIPRPCTEHCLQVARLGLACWKEGDVCL